MPKFTVPPGNMHPRPTCILLLLLSCFPFLAGGTNFTQCLEDFRNDPNGVGGVDFRGYPTSPALADGLTYGTCKSRCSAGPEGFIWRDFTQLFASWLLPWLALVSQLPFGSGNYADDFASGQFSSPSIAYRTAAHLNAYPHATSHHKPWLPCAGSLFPRPYLSECPIRLSEGEAAPHK